MTDQAVTYPAPQLYLRCWKCGKLLAKSNKDGELKAEIKCPRCGTMNESFKKAGGRKIPIGFLFRGR
jgi:phage FluMu protein Com